MNIDETTVINSEVIVDENIKKTLLEICEDLKERGHNPTKQIVAYLVSGDPGYISSYKECRNRIVKFKKEDILEAMLVNFLK
ncbi:MAG: IreB family regulatory phosphoprotein [Bacilli bacterium]|jgi:uncharacterized protein (UPF0297 family)|nr:IreB family regulatory phosphoprotein [Bacilli bacterium]